MSGDDNAPNLFNVDWSKVPPPADDDGITSRLTGAVLPDMALPSTDGGHVTLAADRGCSVVYVYPMTGRPGQPLPPGWDGIPGARGCTPQACAFRDHFASLSQAGADHVYGLSAQSTNEQKEAAERLHLPYPLLSDDLLSFADAAQLPTFQVEGRRLIKRITLIIEDAVIRKVFYPVFPPDRNAAEVVQWLGDNRAH